MANEFYTILTATGRAKLANATVTGTPLALTTMAVGSGDNDGYYNPSEAQKVLKTEVWRGPINNLYVDLTNANWIVAELVISDTVGGFTIREVGVFDSAGALIAVGKYPASYKPTLAAGSNKQLYVRMIMEVSNTAAVTLLVDPSVVLATRAYVDQKVAAHEAAADPHPHYLRKADNLSEIADPVVARRNLGAVNAEYVAFEIDMAKEPLVARMQLPMLNLHRDSGRFFDVDLPANVQVRRNAALSGAAFYVGQIALWNGSVVANAGQFIHDNSTFGGAQGPVNASVISLLEAMGRAEKRYGVEFYIAEITASSAPGTYYPIPLPSGTAWLSCVNYANTQGAVSSMYWIRVLNGEIAAGNGASCYRNGVESSNVISPADDWVHICNVENWLGGYTMSSHIFAIPGARYQIALPSMVPGDVHGAIHQAPILGFEY